MTIYKVRYRISGWQEVSRDEAKLMYDWWWWRLRKLPPEERMKIIEERHVKVMDSYE